MALPSNLSKLVARLASEHDGEILATVGAIGRSLKSAGHDFNDFAAALEGHGNRGAISQQSDSCRQELRAAHTDTAKANCLAKHGGFWLTEREREFVCDLAVKLQRYPGTATFKQRQWLNSLFDRLRRAAA